MNIVKLKQMTIWKIEENGSHRKYNVNSSSFYNIELLPYSFLYSYSVSFLLFGFPSWEYSGDIEEMPLLWPCETSDKLNLDLDLDLELDSCLFFEILDGSLYSDKELFCLLPFDEAARPPLCIGKYRDEVVPVIPEECRCACLTLVELRFSSSLGSG